MCDENETPDYDLCDCGKTIELGRERCEACEEREAWFAWRDQTLDAVEQICKASGWEFERYGKGCSTRSTYHEIWREVDKDEDYEIETIELRISDHGDAHCRADLSLAQYPSGDDTDLDGLRRRLTK